jgi:hypothetical protein
LNFESADFQAPRLPGKPFSAVLIVDGLWRQMRTRSSVSIRWWTTTGRIISESWERCDRFSPLTRAVARFPSCIPLLKKQPVIWLLHPHLSVYSTLLKQLFIHLSKPPQTKPDVFFS